MDIARETLRHSWRAAAWSGVFSVAAAAGTAGLIASINSVMHHTEFGSSTGARLAVLAALVVLAQAASHSILGRASYLSTYRLYIRLSRAMLQIPLARLEAMGRPRVTSV